MRLSPPLSFHLSRLIRAALIVSLLPPLASVLAQDSRDVALRDAPPKAEPEITLDDLAAAPLAVMFTELTPATLVHANGPRLQLFANLQAWGQGPPTHVAAMVDDAVVVASANDADALKMLTGMTRPWLLCWFNGAMNWTRWDAPVLVILQHRPTAITLDRTGLHLSFHEGPQGGAGDVVLMPLYGYDKIPLSAETDFRANLGLPSRGLHTADWDQGLPAPVVERAQTLTSVLRAIPIYCHETFALDGDDLVIRMTFDFHVIDDDWGTPVARLAPLPPTLALAWWAGEHTGAAPFPMSLSGPVRDLDVMTSFGPWAGIPEVDAIELRMPLLPYVRYIDQPRLTAQLLAPPAESDADEPADEITDDLALRRMILNRMRRRLDAKFTTGQWEQIWDYEVDRDYGGPGLYCWQVMNDRWYAKALPYVLEPTRSLMASTLRGYMDNWVLDPQRFQPFQDMLLLVGPGIATWGGYDDAGKFSSNLLDTLWNFAYYLDYWQPIHDHWPMLQKLFITPLEMDWKSMGRYGIAEMGDEAAPPLAYARMAYHVGDLEAYAFGCYIFARELVHHYVKQVGQDYYRLHQPYDNDEPMQGPVWLSNLWGDTAGWQVDGPIWPTVHGERQSDNRWVRFSSFDVARFYRDVLKPQVRDELDELTSRALERGDDNVRHKLFDDAAHITPGLVRLRAMLLDEPPTQLLKLAPRNQWSTWRPGDITAQTLSVVRADLPADRIELIPALRTNAVLGLERLHERTAAPHTCFSLRVPAGEQVYEAMNGWTALAWRGWRSPMPVRGWRGGRDWSFGQIIAPDLDPADRIGKNLSWNTIAILYGTGEGTARREGAADGPAPTD